MVAFSRSMCARFEFNGQRFQPGRAVIGFSATGIVCHVWAGFARREILDWWKRKGGVEIDIPATRFAERSDKTGELRWDDIPAGKVIRGLLDKRTGQPLIKIVTRASDDAEFAMFEHPRMPLFADPLHVTPPFDIGREDRTPGLFPDAPEPPR
jgi:hypothetical protein